MNPYLTQILLSLALCLGACNTSRTEPGNTTTNNDFTEDQTVATPPIPAPAPAPGTVHAKVEVLSISPEQDGYRCKVRIISVNAYGMGARPLPEGTELDTSARKDIIAFYQKSMAAQADDNIDAQGNSPIHEVVLKYQQMPNIPGLEARPWSIQSIQ